jgi:hypothetical protein
MLRKLILLKDRQHLRHQFLGNHLLHQKHQLLHLLQQDTEQRIQMGSKQN